MMQENCQEFPSGMPKRAMPIRESNRDGKTGVPACLGKQASSLFLHLLPWEDRRPRLSRQTGFQPVSSPAILGRQASPPVSANRLPACFFTCYLGKTGVLACPGKQASSLFLICPSVLKCQTTESHIIMTASITILEKFSRRFRDGHRFAFFFLRYYLNHYVFLLL